MLNDLKAGGRWGIFLLHDIADNPGEYAITPTMLDQMAQLIAGSGVAVINYRPGLPNLREYTRTISLGIYIAGASCGIGPHERLFYPSCWRRR